MVKSNLGRMGECLTGDLVTKTGTTSAGSRSAGSSGSMEDTKDFESVEGVFGFDDFGAASADDGADVEVDVGVFGVCDCLDEDGFRRVSRVEAGSGCDRVGFELVVAIRRSDTDLRIGLGDGGGEWWITLRRGFGASGVFVVVGIFDGELARRNL